MHLTDETVCRYVEAGIHDVLLSFHSIGRSSVQIYGRDRSVHMAQVRAVDRLRAHGVPFRINCTVIRDNLPELERVAEFAIENGARVVNYIMFNPYLEWSQVGDIEFQAKFSDLTAVVVRALEKCSRANVEVNVRYLPLCQQRWSRLVRPPDGAA